MNSWDEFPGEQPSPIKRQLQGPRPTPLKVSKNSHKIKKPPVHPHHHHHHHHQQQQQHHYPATEAREPVIIYAVSPKVIHTTETEFMTLVQRLTGPSPTAATITGNVSPAARLATIEKTSPGSRFREPTTIEGFEMGQFPGILSPAPATLPPIQPGYFSPGFDLSLLNDLSPFLSNIFTPSPKSLVSVPALPPQSPSSFDLLSQFFDF